MCGYPRGNVEIIAGSNLPMLIEVNMGRQFVEELEMLTNMAINTGKDQVCLLYTSGERRHTLYGLCTECTGHSGHRFF